MKPWQFNILFIVGVGGAIMLLIGPEVGLNVNQNPTAFTGVGAILTYILTQKNVLTKSESKEEGDDDDHNSHRRLRASSDKAKKIIQVLKEKETEDE